METVPIIALVVVLCTTMGIAQEPPVIESAQVVDYGIYRVDRTGEKVSTPSAASGRVQIATRTTLVVQTNQIPAVVGTTFGFQLILKGQPDGAWVDVVLINEHPAFKRPGSEQTSTSDKIQWRYRIGEKTGYTYTFDHDWEAVPGKWKLEVWSDGRKVVGKEFVVTSGVMKPSGAANGSRPIGSGTNRTSSAPR